MTVKKTTNDTSDRLMHDCMRKKYSSRIEFHVNVAYKPSQSIKGNRKRCIILPNGKIYRRKWHQNFGACSLWSSRTSVASPRIEAGHCVSSPTVNFHSFVVHRRVFYYRHLHQSDTQIQLKGLWECSKLQDKLFFDGKWSVGSSPPEMHIWKMLSVTLTFEPVSLKGHRGHVDLVTNNSDQFHRNTSTHFEHGWENASQSAWPTYLWP